jgi:hypothetical protein
VHINSQHQTIHKTHLWEKSILQRHFVHVHLYVTWEEAIWSHLQQDHNLCVWLSIYCVLRVLVCIPVLVWYIISVCLVQTTNQCLVWYNIYTSGTNYNKPMSSIVSVCLVQTTILGCPGIGSETDFWLVLWGRFRV